MGSVSADTRELSKSASGCVVDKSDSLGKSWGFLEFYLKVFAESSSMGVYD